MSRNSFPFVENISDDFFNNQMRPGEYVVTYPHESTSNQIADLVYKDKSTHRLYALRVHKDPINGNYYLSDYNRKRLTESYGTLAEAINSGAEENLKEYSPIKTPVVSVSELPF